MRHVIDEEFHYYWDECQIVLIKLGETIPSKRIMVKECSECGKPAQYNIQSGWHMDGTASFPWYIPLCEECYQALLEE
jgi:hypothetical protein